MTGGGDSEDDASCKDAKFLFKRGGHRGSAHGGRAAVLEGVMHTKQMPSFFATLKPLMLKPRELDGVLNALLF